MAIPQLTDSFRIKQLTGTELEKLRRRTITIVANHRKYRLCAFKLNINYSHSSVLFMLNLHSLANKIILTYYLFLKSLRTRLTLLAHICVLLNVNLVIGLAYL